MLLKKETIPKLEEKKNREKMKENEKERKEREKEGREEGREGRMGGREGWKERRRTTKSLKAPLLTWYLPDSCC